MKADRRAVIGGMAALAAGAAAGVGFTVANGPDIEGGMAGADLARGHRLRSGDFPEPSAFEETGIVIAGGGIAGLAAGWTLAEAGYGDFQLLELEDRVGGNARSGRNDVSSFPLGAHYLPVANRDARALQHLLRRLGMIVGEKEGVPVYDPYQLCADLQERLFWRGRWQEGLIPATGIAQSDRDDLAAFEHAMASFSERVGSDGRPAFTIPAALSSQEPAILALDSLSFTAWLDSQGWHSPVLRSHLRYCTRDDYGCEPDQVSAWAGIHYFAGRRGWAADGADDRLLTWPEGNDRLASGMAERFPSKIAAGRIVHRLARDGDSLFVDSFDVAAGRTVRAKAHAAILSVPHFVARRIAPAEVPEAADFSYAPWLVANVTVSRLPQGRGVPLAWDNVSASSESLGYVVAAHQGSSAIVGQAVLTWYMPLSRQAPAEARRLLLQRPAAEWQEMVRNDLLASNPELDGQIERIDLWRWGHAMIRPVPGLIWGSAVAAAEVRPPLFLAHSDLSGLSLFEEAHYRGTLAAEGAMRHLGHRFESIM